MVAGSDGAKLKGQTGLCPGCKPLYPGCAPTGKPSSFHSIIQHQFFLAFHSTIFHTNRGQLFAAHGTRTRDFESKFRKTFRGYTPDPLAGGGYPIPRQPPAGPSDQIISHSRTTLLCDLLEKHHRIGQLRLNSVLVLQLIFGTHLIHGNSNHLINVLGGGPNSLRSSGAVLPLQAAKMWAELKHYN